MWASQWAPKKGPGAKEQFRHDKQKQDKEKAKRLLGRLQWKADLLKVSYLKALEIVQIDNTHTTLGISPKQAEAMFKIDFFEFYTLLERFLLSCLSALDIHVSSSLQPPTTLYGLHHVTKPDLQHAHQTPTHAFHANLLAALDDEKCPLHRVLGKADTRMWLGAAKEWRNWWKDADEQLFTRRQHFGTDEDERKRNVQLGPEDLNEMLRYLVGGCVDALEVVLAWKGRAGPEQGVIEDKVGRGVIEGADVPVEFVDDAMDLD